MLFRSRVNTELGKVLQMADARELLAAQGLDAQASTPAELAQRLKADVAKYAKLLQAAGVKPD